MTARIPITLLTGYLGAGKTTLLNRLLRAGHGQRLAVLVNDFGAINVDAALIDNREQDAISLTNGCVCCSISDDLGAALDAQRRRDRQPDRVILEASGVAMTGRIATHAGHWPGFELSAVVVAVDAETLASRADDRYVGRLVRDQIFQADLAVLTKTDLAADGGAVARSLIARIAPGLDVIDACTPGCTDALLTPAVRGGVTHADAPPEGCTATVWTPPGPVAADRLAAALDRLPVAIHRVKGFVVDAATGATLLVQKVGPRSTISTVAGCGPPGLVLIAVGGGSRVPDTAALDACAVICG